MEGTPSTPITSSTTKDPFAAEFLRKAVRVRSKDWRSRALQNRHVNLLQSERRLARMALTVVLIWVVTWTPYALTALMQLLGWGHLIGPDMALAAVFSAKVSAIVNTFVYGLR